MDLHNRKVVTTRKDHKCEGCFETTPKGTEVEHCEGKWQGDFYDYHMCDPCIEYMDDDRNWEDGFTPGEIGSYRKESEMA